MPRFLFRIDAVNIFANAVGDCQQLSVLRGGGLMLLEAVRRLPHEIQGAEIVSMGSSSLTCSVECADAKGLASRLEDGLNRGWGELKTQHATFTVSFVPEGADFQRNTESLAAKSRWQQMQSASVAVPAGGRDVCRTDMVPPATTDLGGHIGRASQSEITISGRWEWCSCWQR